MAVSKNDKSELFNLTNVSMKMDNIEEHFSSFADTLNTINGLVQSEVNAGLGSAAFGDLGGKLINIQLMLLLLMISMKILTTGQK